MNNKHIISMAAMLTASLAAASAQTITDWNFDGLGTQAAPYNSPAPSFGTGTATVLGMANDYNDGTIPSTPFADITATAGASTGAGSYAWRIRGGNTVAGTPNGWSTQAPIATQGAEFTTSTVGFNNIQVSFDLYTTSAAEANVALLYTLNGGTTWTDAAITYSGAMTAIAENNTTSANTISGAYLRLATSGGGWYNGITADLTGVAGANNNSGFGIEIVNASTGADNINQTGGAYNNSSGNFRLDNIEVEGVPEPGPLALAGLGLAAFGFLRKFRKA